MNIYGKFKLMLTSRAMENGKYYIADETFTWLSFLTNFHSLKYLFK